MEVDTHHLKPYIPIVVGVTGHRDLREEDIQTLEKKVHNILLELKNFCPNSPITLLSPLAEGSDRLVARVALNMGIRLIVPLPMPIEEYRKDFKLAVSQNEFKELLAKADRYFELPFVGGNTLENIIQVGSKRELQYEQVGAYIARNSQILIALWDGILLEKPAGTSKVVHFKLEGIPEPYVPMRSRLDPVENGPVYHLFTPRQKNVHTTGDLFSIHKYFPESFIDYGNPENSFKMVLKKIDIYNHDINRLATGFADEIKKNKAYIIQSDEEKKLSADAKSILEHYAVADTMAQYFQSKSQKVLVGILVLVVCAFFLFQIYLEFFKHPLLLLFYPAILSLAFIWYAVAKRGEYQNKHLDYRAIAEGQRVQLFWKLIKLKDGVAEHYLRKQRSELDWIRHAIRTSSMTVVEKNPEMDVALSDYSIVLEHWVNDQRNYFTKATERESRKLEKQERISSVCYWSGLGLAVTMLVIHGFLHSMEILHHILVVSIAMALALAAAIQGHIEKVAFSEHIKQYVRMRDLFLHASKHLTAFLKEGDLSKAQNLIKDLGKEALMENGDWVLLHRSRPIGVPKG